ncbi:31.0 kDa [Spodoptera frugiperda ascovirus 1a]|uniref:31.0 kDa n=1 Tax=Spodoptera frugiperda ascovirus 1a TaxID=113370 RepID=Q0E525_SFAVA|nr:31.0 kDa [Spodoptera frugiperda ascovirus 1a]CAL44676.1 31.0 kDa [Spodoptera frugiperda ascovirus 1a]
MMLSSVHVVSEDDAAVNRWWLKCFVALRDAYTMLTRVVEHIRRLSNRTLVMATRERIGTQTMLYDVEDSDGGDGGVLHFACRPDGNDIRMRYKRVRNYYVVDERDLSKIPYYEIDYLLLDGVVIVDKHSPLLNVVWYDDDDKGGSLQSLCVQKLAEMVRAMYEPHRSLDLEVLRDIRDRLVRLPLPWTVVRDVLFEARVKRHNLPLSDEWCSTRCNRCERTQTVDGARPIRTFFCNDCGSDLVQIDRNNASEAHEKPCDHDRKPLL